jgi:hypothetical protein
MNPFSVSELLHQVKLYQVRYPMYSPSILCQTQINGEYTVYKYTDEEDEAFRLLSVQHDPHVYTAFIIHEDCPGINHVGIVYFLSGLFTKADIPILYLNTYSYNVILISEEHVEEARKMMKQHKRILFDVEKKIEKEIENKIEKKE